MGPENQRTCDMLSVALDMETKGKAFYDRATQKCKDPNCVELFRMLASMEVQHIKRIDKIFDSLSRGQGWCQLDQDKVHQDLGKIFLELTFKHGADITADSTDLDAIETGLELEKQSITYYQEALARAEAPEEKEFLDALVQEEKMHHQGLADMKLYLENPSSWFNEKEKPHWDGA